MHPLDHSTVHQGLLLPADKQAEHPDDRGHADRTGHQNSYGPTHPAHTLGPGIAEGTGFEFAGQDRRTGEHPDKAGQEHQDHTDQADVGVGAVEGLPPVVTFDGIAGCAGQDGGVRGAGPYTGDDQIGGQQREDSCGACQREAIVSPHHPDQA